MLNFINIYPLAIMLNKIYSLYLPERHMLQSQLMLIVQNIVPIYQQYINPLTIEKNLTLI